MVCLAQAGQKVREGLGRLSTADSHNPDVQGRILESNSPLKTKDNAGRDYIAGHEKRQKRIRTTYASGQDIED